MKTLRITLFLAALTLVSFAQAAVWEDTETWSPAMEARYEQWVKTSWNKNFFMQAGTPYTGLRTDCADTVYSMRIIFSYENRLPFHAVDPTGGTSLISNRMSRWDDVADEKLRIRKFLSFVYFTMSTRSLPNDTYPVAVGRQTIRAGGLILTTAKNHHSWTIQDLAPIGVPHLIYNSTVGATSGLLLKERTSWPNPAWVFEGNFTPAGNAGIRDWRKAEDLKKPVWQVQGYSDEQYKIPLNKWNATMESKLAIYAEADEARVKRLADTVCRGLQERVAAVQESADFQKSTGYRCMNEAEYDTYSTPSRDRRVFDDLMALRQAYKKVGAVSEETKRNMDRIFPFLQDSAAVETQKTKTQRVSDLGFCTVDIPGFQKIDLAEFKRRMFLGMVSSNPNDSLQKRWGFNDPATRGGACPNWGTWTPNLGSEH